VSIIRMPVNKIFFISFVVFLMNWLIVSILIKM